ncbi:MAG: LCP family protein [Clostridium sp.]
MGNNRESFNGDKINNKAVDKLKNKKVMIKKRKARRITSLIIMLFVVAIIGIGIYVYSFLTSLNSSSLPGAVDPIGKNPVNILILGMDIGDAEQASSEVGRRTDTMMVLNFNPGTKKVKVISVPRDTMIEVDGAFGEDGKYQKHWKMNAAYALGGNEEVTSQIENILEIQINYMVKIDYDAFRNIIDAIGGVEMYIENDMYYDDDGQNLHINFNKGETVLLDGKKAEEFFRWRQNNDGTGFANGDLDRIENQQKFMAKLMEKCLSPSVVVRIPKILNAVSDSLDTNLEANQMLKYAMQFVKLGKGDVEMTTIQGETQDIYNQSFFIYDRDMNLELLKTLHSGDNISSTGNTNAESVIDTSKIELKSSLNIMVLNATSINGLAGNLQAKLDKLGYGNIDTGNTEKQDKSVVMTNNKEIKEIKEMLKTDTSINKSGKITESDYEKYDVVIIVGKDYDLFGE